MNSYSIHDEGQVMHEKENALRGGIVTIPHPYSEFMLVGSVMNN